ncbi:MAG: TatD family hydrolase [Spirochaetes bacterium]|nr:TatD family hydrolase [Spirochaetota bacterium]
MNLVDAHCHLESDHFVNDLDRVINEARCAGIVKLITSSITPGQWELSRSIADRYAEVECALGIHPWYIRESYRDAIQGLYAARDLGAVAIGEIGLDRKSEMVPFDRQLDFFEAQLSVAREIDLPVIIHCRGAFNELILSLKQGGPLRAGGIIHSFSGSPELADELIRLGLSFSMGGTLTYRNSKKRAAVMKRIYPGHFLLETDSPDIPPVQKHGEINRPHYILYSLEAAVEITGDTVEQVAEHTTANAMRLFNLRV